MNEKERTIELWNKAVERYEKRNSSLHNLLILPFIIRNLNNKKLRILDFGCGTGQVAYLLANLGHEVVGIDISERMIEYAIRKKQETATGRAPTFIATDIAHLTNVGRFDCIISINVYANIPIFDNIVHDFKRLLKRGGIVISTFEHPCFTTWNPGRHNRDTTYLDRYSFTTWFLGEDAPILGFHRPMSYYANLFSNEGFRLNDLYEPLLDAPQDETVTHKKWLHQPIFIFMVHTKE